MFYCMFRVANAARAGGYAVMPAITLSGVISLVHTNDIPILIENVNATIILGFKSLTNVD
jgi:hypothetical protein